MSGSLRAILRPQRLILRSGPQGPAGDGGAGAVDSVNGQTGVVVLDASDVGADAAGTAASLVGTEATTRANADTTLGNAISAEATTRGNADTALQTAITAEETARIAADGVLTTSIGTVASNLSAHEALTKGAHGMTTFGAGFVAQTDAAGGRGALGLGSAATQTAQVAPATSRVPLSRSGLARLRPGWAREVGIGTPTAGEDNTLGYEVGDTWTYQGRHYVAESVATGAANWIAGLIASDATATPTASKIPIADGAGKLAAGWLPAATTTTPGAVELATDLEATSSVVPTGADTRLGWAFRSLHLAVGY